MRKLLLMTLLGVLLLPALPGGARTNPISRPTPITTSTPTPTPSPTPSTTPTGSPTSTFAQTSPGSLTYAGRGITGGLTLTINGQGIRTGLTTTRVANAATPECSGIACARAAGAAEPIGENAEAMSPGDGGPDTVQAFDIGEGGSEDLERLLTGTFGAASAQTTGRPSATGTADGMTADVVLSQTVVGQLPTGVTDGIEDGLDQIIDALAPIAEGDPTGTIAGLTDALDDLVDDLASGPLVRIHGGSSTSSTQFETGRVSASATAAGAVIVLLPTPASTALLPQGVAVIEVGPSSAAATANGTNRATADASGSIAKITLLPGVLDEVPGLDPDLIDELPLDDILDLLPEELTDLLPIDDLMGSLSGAAAGQLDEGEGDDAEGDDGEGDDGEGEDGADEDGADAEGENADGADAEAADGGDGAAADAEPTGSADTDGSEAPTTDDQAADPDDADGEDADGQDTDGEDADGEDAAEDADQSTDGEFSATPLQDVIGEFMQADESSGGFVIEIETGTEQTCILEDTPLETCVTLGGTSETFTADGLGVGVLAAGVDISAIRGADTNTSAGPGLIELAVGRSEAGVAAAFVRAPVPTTTTRPPLPQTGGDSSFMVPSLALMALSGVALATLRRRRDV